MTRGMWKGQVSSEPVELQRRRRKHGGLVGEEPTSPVPASPPSPPASHMSRLRMGRKCLVSLTAKMMLGMRKKVQHPRLNQKAFCKERPRS